MSYETEFLLPRLGEGDGGGRIIQWLKSPGDHFEADEPVLEVETDKAVVEVPAPTEGRMLAWIAEVDDLVDHLDPVAKVEFAGEPPAKTAEPEPAAEPVAAPAADAATPGTSSAGKAGDPAPADAGPAVRAASGGRVPSSPWARTLARQLGVDLGALHGSGPHGRVVGADVERAGTAGSVAPARAMTFAVEERQVDVGGGKLFAKQWKPQQQTADGVVLVHGLFGDVDAWSANASVLARQGIPVTAIDLPCHGRSSALAERFEEAVEQLARALEQLHPAPFVLVGHSFGGGVAARVAARIGARLRGLCLLAPVGLGTDIDQGFVDGMLHGQTIEALEREMRKLTAKPAAVGREFLEPLLARIGERREALTRLCSSVSAGGVQQLDIVPDLEALDVPVRLIHGRRDQVIPFVHALNAPAKVALHLLPEAGHMPQWESSTLVAAILAALCARQAA